VEVTVFDPVPALVKVVVWVAFRVTVVTPV
jgi:hypothetical protein